MDPHEPMTEAQARVALAQKEALEGVATTRGRGKINERIPFRIWEERYSAQLAAAVAAIEARLPQARMEADAVPIASASCWNVESNPAMAASCRSTKIRTSRAPPSLGTPMRNVRFSTWKIQTTPRKNPQTTAEAEAAVNYTAAEAAAEAEMAVAEMGDVAMAPEPSLGTRAQSAKRLRKSR